MAKKALATVDYQAIQTQRMSEIQHAISDRLRESNDSGLGDTLRFLVLSRVSQGGYDLARQEINDFIQGNWRYPNFQSRIERYRRYSLDLINAIEAKRSFPGLAALPLAKQQEIYESVIAHFEDLKANLKVIERVEKEVKLEDIRSTVWVVKAFTHSVLFVVGSAFIAALNGGLGASMSIVYGAFVKDVTQWLSQHTGF